MKFASFQAALSSARPVFEQKYEVFGMTNGISMLHTTAGWWFQIFLVFIPIWGTFSF